MTGDHWARLEVVFHAALPLAPEERQTLLARECGADAALRAGVERLLAAHDRVGGFIQTPAVAAAGARDR